MLMYQGWHNSNRDFLLILYRDIVWSVCFMWVRVIAQSTIPVQPRGLFQHVLHRFVRKVSAGNIRPSMIKISHFLRWWLRGTAAVCMKNTSLWTEATETARLEIENWNPSANGIHRVVLKRGQVARWGSYMNTFWVLRFAAFNTEPGENLFAQLESFTCCPYHLHLRCADWNWQSSTNGKMVYTHFSFGLLLNRQGCFIGVRFYGSVAFLWNHNKI